MRMVTGDEWVEEILGLEIFQSQLFGWDSWLLQEVKTIMQLLWRKSQKGHYYGSRCLCYKGHSTCRLTVAVCVYRAIAGVVRPQGKVVEEVEDTPSLCRISTLINGHGSGARKFQSMHICNSKKIGYLTMAISWKDCSAAANIACKTKSENT